MTIVVHGDDAVVEQVEKQLNKIIPVIKVKAYKEGEYLSRQLSLIKVAAPPSKRAELMKIDRQMTFS